MGVKVMDIAIMSKDGFIGIISSSDLDGLIEKSEILAFMRSDGWVRIGQDPIRKRQQPFDGLGRRADDRPQQGSFLAV
jgi:hypothetical protein